MRSRKTAKFLFTAAVVFLIIAGSFSAIAIHRLTASLNWVAHTYDVQVSLGDISSSMTAAGRARAGFVASGEQSDLQRFESAVFAIPAKLSRLEHLISDNSEQRDAVARLRDLEERRLAVLQAAIARRKLGPVDDATLGETTRQMVSLGPQADSVTSEMLANEERLLIS